MPRISQIFLSVMVASSVVAAELELKAVLVGQSPSITQTESEISPQTQKRSNRRQTIKKYAAATAMGLGAIALGVVRWRWLTQPKDFQLPPQGPSNVSKTDSNALTEFKNMPPTQDLGFLRKGIPADVTIAKILPILWKADPESLKSLYLVDKSTRQQVIQFYQRPEFKFDLRYRDLTNTSNPLIFWKKKLPEISSKAEDTREVAKQITKLTSELEKFFQDGVLAIEHIPAFAEWLGKCMPSNNLLGTLLSSQKLRISLGREPKNDMELETFKHFQDSKELSNLDIFGVLELNAHAKGTYESEIATVEVLCKHLFTKNANLHTLIIDHTLLHNDKLLELLANNLPKTHINTLHVKLDPSLRYSHAEQQMRNLIRNTNLKTFVLSRYADSRPRLEGYLSLTEWLGDKQDMTIRLVDGFSLSNAEDHQHLTNAVFGQHKASKIILHVDPEDKTIPGKLLKDWHNHLQKHLYLKEIEWRTPYDGTNWDNSKKIELESPLVKTNGSGKNVVG